jgi:hypothetical protein
MVTLSGMAGLMQLLGLWSLSSSLTLVWLMAAVHLTPLSSYKNWFHFVGPYYLSLLLGIVWLALITPLGCTVISAMFSGKAKHS